MKINCAFVTTFHNPVPGREKAALDFAAESEQYWGKLAAAGKCTPPEWFFTIEGKGLWMVKGERSILEEHAFSEAGRQLLAKGDLLLADFDFSWVLAGSGVDDYMTSYASAAAGLGVL